MDFFVLGLGRSGGAVARFLQERGEKIEAWDDNDALREEAKNQGVSVACPPSFHGEGTMVASPGISFHPLKEAALKAGWRVICDLQLFFDFFPSTRAIGITGSNGKSTTCALIHHALGRQGVLSLLAGNIGIPIFSTLIQGRPPQDALYIVEFSSYQLELCTQLDLEIGAVLNLIPHHLERHGSMAHYRQIKEKIFQFSRMQIGAPQFAEHFPNMKCFSLQSLERIHLPSALHSIHNQLNSAAASMILKELGYRPAFEEFCGLPHRQEQVGCFQGISYWNDSKATNPHSSAAAIQALSSRSSLREPLYWICGGVLQEDDLGPLETSLCDVSCAFVIGDSCAKYQQFLASRGVPVKVSKTLDRAVFEASELALKACRQKEGLTASILLSPGCASFDQFHDFCHRGEVFKQLVNAFWSRRDVA